MSRALAVAALLLAATVAAVALNVSYGELKLPLARVLPTLVGAGEAADRFVIVELRLPRALVAAGAGAVLALSGAILQTLARNPLASPDVIGITAGASLAGVTALAAGAATAAIPAAAFAGALGAAALMYALAWRGGLSPFRLVLVGIGIAAAAQAGISYVLVRGRIEDAQQAYVWLVGSVNLRTWADVWPLAAGLLVLAPAVAALSRPLDALALGEDTARALGVGVERARLALVVAAAALAAFGVAAAGPIGFVAFMAPHVARRLVRAPGAAALPAAAFCGAALVPAADLAGRVIAAPAELPVGIVTSLLGAPFFLALLWRSRA